ncbi:TetR/AcrR family transcriptional regulator [Hoeflea sp. CAU 1731]
MSQDSEHRKRKPGRPRDEGARKAILDAAYRMLMERGLGRLTVEAVAGEAGVGKPTIYRYWANAQELAMAALISRTSFRGSDPDEAVSVDTALKAHMADVVAVFSTARGRQIVSTMASADTESELSKAFRGQIIEGSRAIGREILTAAENRGEIHLGESVEQVLDFLYAPVFYRLLTGKPIDRGYTDRTVELIDRLLSGCSCGSSMK